ncbi:MAG: hypothetical protein ACRD2X_21565, partial [Vicinamibacteraceae bacterium]
ILDSLFTVVFLFDDLPERTNRFYRSGWREMKEELNRYRAQYSDDPEWEEWLTGFAELVSGFKAEVGISGEEERNFRSIKWFPNPGKMIRDVDLSQDRRQFLEFLNDWFYRELSADSHLAWPGLARRGISVLEDDRDKLEKMRSDAAMLSSILLTALISEVQVEIRWPDTLPRVQYVWTILLSAWSITRDLYEQRYSQLVSI